MKKQTTVAALGAIAKQLKKIAKELKRANDGADPLEEVYVLTEKGKELAEQHKDECEELSNKPSDEEARAAIKTLSDYCDLQAANCRCKKCIFFTDTKCLIEDLPDIKELNL